MGYSKHQKYSRMSEKFCLKWNDFQTNVPKSFGLFRNEEYLQDVTLVSDDHNKVSAHRLVLSTSSDYFRDIFKNNQHSHPLICLDGIFPQDLKNILDYIYNGEVQIFQDDLDRFLIVAQRFKLEGLMGGKAEGVADNQDDAVEDNYYTNAVPTFPTEKEVTIEKRDAFSVSGSNEVALNSERKAGFYDDQVIQYLEECSNGSYRCTACGKTSDNVKGARSKQRHNMMKHIETHLEGLSYSCPFCEKTFRSKNSLSGHKARRICKN